MAEYMGSALYVQWTYSTAGTLSMAADYRKFTYTPSVDILDATAGSDASKVKTVSFKDGKGNLSGLIQASGTPTGGTASLLTAFVEGQIGTFIVGPEGTAVGKPKMTIPAISQGINWAVQYNTLMEYSIPFEQNGARTDGTF